MSMNDIFRNGVKRVRSNDAEVLTAIGVTGVLSTAYFAAKGGYAAARRLAGEAPDMPLKEKARMVWDCYIPAGVSTTVTVACILGATKLNSKRTAAAVTAYSVAEKAFSEYKEHVIEEIGDKKEEALRARVAQKAVSETESNGAVLIGTGQVLCHEAFSGRYFSCDMETLRKAQNDINARIISDLYVTLNEFYDILGLEHTGSSGDVGWDSNRMMELEFSTVLHNGTPCLSFDYNYIKSI